VTTEKEKSRRVAFYDTKPYDREYFGWAVGGGGLDLVFHDFRLGAANAVSAEGASVVCVFVNDKLDRECLEILAERGVGMVALRYAVFQDSRKNDIFIRQYTNKSILVFNQYTPSHSGRFQRVRTLSYDGNKSNGSSKMFIIK
jgi:hypothetical protein